MQETQSQEQTQSQNPSDSPPNSTSQESQSRPQNLSSLSEAAERKRQLNLAHELMAEARRGAKAYLEAIDECLDVFMETSAQKPDLDKRFNQAVRRFYRAGLSVTSGYQAYCRAFIVTVDPKKSPELAQVPPETVR